jgi:hypothetical protein
MSISHPKFDLSKYKKFYQSIGAVRCSYFGNESIAFNSKGFDHLVFKNGERRNFGDCIRRLKLLKYCRRILEGSYITVEHTIEPTAQFWALDAFIDGLKMRLLVRKLGAGNKHFFDIFPLKH